MNLLKILTLLLIFYSPLSHAEENKNKEYIKGLSLKGEGSVYILGFNSSLELVELISVKRPGEGVFWVKKKDLLRVAKFDQTKDARILSQIKSDNHKLRCTEIELNGVSIPTFMEDQKVEDGSKEDWSNEPLNPCSSKN